MSIPGLADAPSRPLRIALVTGPGEPSDGSVGASADVRDGHVGGLAAALAAIGHDVTVWARRDRADLPAAFAVGAGVTLRQVDAGPAQPTPVDGLIRHLPALAAGLRAAWTAQPPDVVHAHHWTSGLACVAAVRGLGVPVVQSFPTLGAVERRYADPVDPRPSGRVRAEQHLLAAVDRVVAACVDEAAELVGTGAPRDRIAVVPCGVDTTALTPDRAGRGPRLGGRPRLLAMGGWGRPQGVDDILIALERVPDPELIVVGGTGAADPDLARLRRQAAASGVAHRVRFVGPAPRSAVAGLLRSADAVVCVPWHESRPTVALAAMACGRPVVASAVGALVDVLVDGTTGLLVPPRRPRDTAAALRRVLAAPARAMAMGVAARDRAEMRYDWRRIAAETSAVYADAVAERAPRPVAETATDDRAPAAGPADRPSSDSPDCPSDVSPLSGWGSRTR